MDVSTEAVLCTGELQLRPSRPPDFEKENHIIGALVQALAESPEGILQAMVEIMLETFHVGSAGCSVLVDKGESPRFSWPAIAGAWKGHIGGGTPRDFGPCGDVLDRNVPLLFRQPQRRYEYLRDVVPPIEECLLVPFYVGAVAVGTLWLVAHDERRKFDLEDLRLLLSLSRFTTSAYQAHTFAERMRDMNEALLLGNLRQHESAAAEAKLIRLLRDEIVERKAIEVALHEATFKAHQASLAKTEFLNNMSHELRTPLNAMLGHALVMERTSALSEVQKHSVTQIQKAGWHLAELINEVLDLAQIEAGKFSVQREPIALGEVLLECQAMIEPLAQARAIKVSFPHLENTAYVLGDHKRIKQVLINLLSNAIKYNRPEGTVVVGCLGDDPERIRISVTDTGKGLTEAQLSQLFKLFNRLDHDAHTVDGTGIGLVMVKRLTELMGGTVGADSTVGTGSNFWIELQRAPIPSRNSIPGLRASC